MRKRIVAIIAACVLTVSCSPFFGAKRGDESFYVLADNGKMTAEPLPQHNTRLLVADAKANAFINSQKIIFSEGRYTRGYYQLARWVESPADRFTLLLIERLNRAKSFSTVSRLGSSGLGDVQLNTEIIDFFHDTEDMPGKTVVRVNAELVDLTRRTSLGTQSFEQQVPVKEYSAEGAVKAFTQAVNKILDDIVVWTAQTAP